MQTHDSMIQTLVNHLARNGFTTIHADLPGFQQPAEITWRETGKGHIPDVTAFKAAHQYVFEVETADSLGNGHTEDQLRLFGAFASQHNASFYLVVPSRSEATARSLLVRLDVVGDVWTVG